jgi:hypothetical protein
MLRQYDIDVDVTAVPSSRPGANRSNKHMHHHGDCLFQSPGRSCIHRGATERRLPGSPHGAHGPRPLSGDAWINCLRNGGDCMLILPTLWYAVFYERCNGPGREVIHMLCGGANCPYASAHRPINACNANCSDLFSGFYRRRPFR